MYLLAEFAAKPLEVIRQELGSWEPWKVVVSVAVILILLAWLHKVNKA